MTDATTMTTTACTPGEGEAVGRALDRHARRRRQGIPTLSVLLAKGAGETGWGRWVEAAGTGLRAVSVPWPRAAEDLLALESRVAPLWVPPSPAPTAGGEGSDGLAVAVNLLAVRLERGVPPGAWVCGLLVDADAAAAYLVGAPESRAKAYFREGLIGVPEGSRVAGGEARAAARRVLLAANPGHDLDPAARARVEAAANEVDAAGTLDAVDVDRARSAAERFLFAMLEAMPGTAGQFALNAPLPGDVRFGPRAAEVDLLALGPRVAVEVDGYHHFTDAERYRRDRRKDVLLQEQGFLVLRFLAEDVVPRLETILDTVRAAVARRLTSSS